MFFTRMVLATNIVDAENAAGVTVTVTVAVAFALANAFVFIRIALAKID